MKDIISYRNSPKSYSIIFTGSYAGSSSAHYGVGGIQIPTNTTGFDWEYIDGTLFSSYVVLRIRHNSGGYTTLSNSADIIYGNINSSSYNGDYIEISRKETNGTTAVKVTFYFY